MQKTLEHLYKKQIYPAIASVNKVRVEGAKENAEIMGRAQEEYMSRLTKEEIRKFEDVIDKVFDSTFDDTTQSFVDGFKLGTKLMLEVLIDETS